MGKNTGTFCNNFEDNVINNVMFLKCDFRSPLLSVASFQIVCQSSLQRQTVGMPVQASQIITAVGKC